MEGPDRPALGRDGVEQSELGQDRLAGRLEQEPGTDRAGLRATFEDRDVVAVACEGDRQRGTTDAEPRDCDPHRHPAMRHLDTVAYMIPGSSRIHRRNGSSRGSGIF